MTIEHVFFVPIIFILGFFAGGLVSRKGQGVDQNSAGPPIDPAAFSSSARALLIALVVFLVVFVATHAFPIPNSAVAVKLQTHGQSLLDTRPSFSSLEVYQRIDAFGPAGREIYQRFLYSIDIIFPLSFLAFLFLLARYVGQRSTLSHSKKTLLMALPLLWFLADMLENSITFSLLAFFPLRRDVLAGVLGFVTVTKFSLLLLALAAPAMVSTVYRQRTSQ